jgi:hypothetical protein
LNITITYGDSYMFLRKTSTRAKNIGLIAKIIAGIFLSISLAQASENSLDAIAATINLPQTGQTPTSPIPAIPGMDGYTYFGVPWAYNPTGPLNPPTRFTVGTGAQSDCITDNLTGLMWARNSSDTQYTWDNAIKSTASGGAIPSNLCGYTDWRLPNVNELTSLTNDGYIGLQSDWLQSQGFSNVPTNDYWSSSSHQDIPIESHIYTTAWSVSMDGGIVIIGSKTNTGHVLPVRDGLATAPAQIPQTGQTSTSPINPAPAGSDGALRKGVAWPTTRFSIGSGCITDKLTGLMWAQDPTMFNTPSWDRALTYVADMNNKPGAIGYNLCGHKDWHLPNKNELKSLVNWGSINTLSWLQSQGFNTPEKWAFYWTSSTFAQETDLAWIISMNDGSTMAGGKRGSGSTLMWPVRSGQ